MAISDLATASENLFTAISGEAVSDTVKSNVTDATSILALGLSILQRSTSFNVDGVVAGSTEALNGITQAIKAARTPLTTSVPAIAGA
ncbi:hypothetical protein [Gluconobacter albidus]|uniref:Uncharacterized protein n=1 Tax=Gluconobacter albidus TaxID=318683 RepID=A0A149TJ23_9PROT|nr:hypothetical protein [Gluconobacter albidus]KXV48199.1 hypothetical protein AD945_08310 [Gluconobacter albidus]MBS1028322.1 hypothetical protein [Gluconobacter albidus]